jgi:tetratricopeptide (TPR) repeat protein
VAQVQFGRVFAASVFCCVTAFAYQKPGAVQAFKEAHEFFDQQQWDKAQAAAEKALAADPSLGDAEILEGLIATLRSQFPEAEKHFVKAVALEPGNYQAHAYLGSTYLQEKRLSEADGAFRKVLQLNPGNAAANYNLGLIALQRNAATEALRRFETVLRVSRSDVPALTGVLTCHLMLRRTSDARRTAEQLQQLLQDRDPRLLQVAALLAEHGDSAAAIPILERVRQVFPQSWNVSYNLAVAYCQSARYDRAADIVRPFAGPQGKAEAFDLLGAIQEKQGRTAEVEQAFQEAAMREPSNEEYRFDYGNSFVQHGKVASAIEVFRAAVADLPRSWKLRAGLGSACYLAGDYESAAQALLEAVRLKPDATPAWFLLGEAYESATRSQPAIETAFGSYLKSAPRDAWAYYHYGAILYQRAQASGRADYHEAVLNLNQALRLDPKLAQAYLELGLIAMAEGKTEQSITALQKAVSLEPGLAAAHYRLGLAYQRLGNGTRAQEEMSRFRALKQDERERGRVLESLAAMAANAPSSEERP